MMEEPRFSLPALQERTINFLKYQKLTVYDDVTKYLASEEAKEDSSASARKDHS